MGAINPDTAVSNSFDYVPVRPIPGFILDPAACSARDHGLAASGTSRVVLVNAAGRASEDGDGGLREVGRTVLCRTDTADFDEAEIRHVVHDRGQLYLDVSGKPSIDDFATDVRQLVLARECMRCPDFVQCCCCYLPAETSFFDQDQRWLADMMKSLGGRVLDVGLGNVPYMGFMPIPPDGEHIEYHGVDPDPDAGKTIAGVTVHQIGIEDFAGFDGYFDHVLSLRSLNHFLDVGAALESVHRCLKPGGQAVFMESLALPLVRSRHKALTSHQAAAGGFQHLRNWDSSQLLEVVERMNRFGRGFRVTFHRPIGPDTCDQWIVVMTAA
ncbi:MAG TPA: class I SAM-dependent methyltransferase [Myxococcota bacterium]|nr:class I SAM-dependent methyltransferase [Myxococcota bacterium]HOH77054.1 class I SAM-dependent methyltransferase [Myxococcota bacterium]